MHHLIPIYPFPNVSGFLPIASAELRPSNPRDWRRFCASKGNMFASQIKGILKSKIHLQFCQVSQCWIQKLKGFHFQNLKSSSSLLNLCKSQTRFLPLETLKVYGQLANISIPGHFSTLVQKHSWQLGQSAPSRHPPFRFTCHPKVKNSHTEKQPEIPESTKNTRNLLNMSPWLNHQRSLSKPSMFEVIWHVNQLFSNSSQNSTAAARPFCPGIWRRTLAIPVWHGSFTSIHEVPAAGAAAASASSACAAASLNARFLASKKSNNACFSPGRCFCRYPPVVFFHPKNPSLCPDS